MVIVFATVVFTGSILKGTRDLFAKSIKTDQDSNSNGGAISGEPQDTIKDSPHDGTPITHTLVNQSRKSKTTGKICFQSYSSDDFFTCAEDTLAVKDHRDQGDASKERKDSKQCRNETTLSATVEADHAKDETSQIRYKVPRSGMQEDHDTVETSVSDERKPKSLSFQSFTTSQRSQIRHRRKRPKTLKIEIEEAGTVTSEDGENQITTEPEPQLEKRSLQRLCDEINKEMRSKNVYRDKSGELNTVHSKVSAEVNGTLGNSRSSRDDSSITKDEPTGGKHHGAEESQETIEHFPDEEGITAKDSTISRPVVVTGKLEEVQIKGYSTDDENKKILLAFKGENDGASKDTGTDSHTADVDEAHLPQELICSYDNRRPYADDLSTERTDALPVDAGDTVQEQIKIENHQSQEGNISETGDFGKIPELDHEEASAANVNSGRTTRMKHRSQKGIEDKLLLKQNIHPENDATLKESIIESNSQPSTEKYEDETQPSAVVKTQTARKNAIVYANDASSPVRTGIMNKILTPVASSVDLTDALDQVVTRFNGRGKTLNALQDSGQISGEPERRSDEELKSLEEADNAKHIELYLGSLSDKFEHLCTIPENKLEVPQIVAPHQDIVRKKELNGFFENFSGSDSVRAYWNCDYFEVENNPIPYQNNDIIAMALESSDQQRRRTDRRHLKERITMATCHLATIDRETAKEEGRLLKLVQEVGDARLESEKSKQKLQEEQNHYREFLLGCCKTAEDDKALDARSRAVEFALQALRRRKWKTDVLLKSATGEVKLLDHRIKKEQALQKEQRDRRLGDKRRRVQRTSLKVNTLAALIILQIILIVIIALWRL